MSVFTEMVLNLSTQIGLNLTRPGQELDYSDMLDTSFSSSLQVIGSCVFADVFMFLQPFTHIFFRIWILELWNVPTLATSGDGADKKFN